MVRAALILAAAALIIAGIYHVALIFGDPTCSTFAGAPPEIEQSLREGTATAPVVISLIALFLFGVAGAGLSGANLLPRPPLLRWIPGGVAILFLLRGAAIIPQAMAAKWTAAFDLFHLSASALIIFIGAAYLAGALRPPARVVSP